MKMQEKTADLKMKENENKYYLRSPFHVALLMVSTFGLYTLWWMARNRWLAETHLGVRHRAGIYWMLIFIPIVNFFIYCGALNVIEKDVDARYKRGPIPFWLYGVLGTPTGLILWFVPTMQAYLYHADLSAQKLHRRSRLSQIEIAIISIGLLWEALAIFGSKPNDGTTIVGWVIVWILAIIFLLAPFFLVTKRIESAIIAESLTKCEWCLSNIPKAARVCRECHRDLQSTAHAVS